ncbi:MAG: hypothetical protein ABIH52_02645 [Candidatus Aenigmatarchaeota archaeon]
MIVACLVADFQDEDVIAMTQKAMMMYADTNECVLHPFMSMRYQLSRKEMTSDEIITKELLAWLIEEYDDGTTHLILERFREFAKFLKAIGYLTGMTILDVDFEKEDEDQPEEKTDKDEEDQPTGTSTSVTAIKVEIIKSDIGRRGELRRILKIAGKKVEIRGDVAKADAALNGQLLPLIAKMKAARTKYEDIAKTISSRSGVDIDKGKVSAFCSASRHGDLINKLMEQFDSGGTKPVTEARKTADETLVTGVKVKLVKSERGAKRELRRTLNVEGEEIELRKLMAEVDDALKGQLFPLVAHLSNTMSYPNIAKEISGRIGMKIPAVRMTSFGSRYSDVIQRLRKKVK